MRVNDNGCFYTVSFTKQDVEAFNRTWPCSSLKGGGSFTFEKHSGDLVDTSEAADKFEGDESVAFSMDMAYYGKERLTGKTKDVVLKEILENHSVNYFW